MRKSIFGTLAAAVVSLGLANMVDAQTTLPPQEVNGPEFDNIGTATVDKSKAGNAFYVSCAFIGDLPGGEGKVWTLPLMFVVNTEQDRPMPPNDRPIKRSFAQTFDSIQDPRNIFDKNGEVTVIDHRPVYMSIEWRDPHGRDTTILLPYAGAVLGLHKVPGILGHGRLEPSFEPKDWRVIPGGTLDHILQAKCNAYETERGSVVMGASK